MFHFVQHDGESQWLALIFIAALCHADRREASRRITASIASQLAALAEVLFILFTQAWRFIMDEEAILQLLELIRIHRRSLQALQQQAAVFGLTCPPAILLQIEDEKKTIHALKIRIKDLVLYETLSRFGYTLCGHELA
jgi:hypothetical protein